MALIQIHRFNWMGHEGTMSETLNLGLLRHTDMSNLRYSDHRQREEVVADIRMRLKMIKRDLGLLPSEGDAEQDENKNDVGTDAFGGADQEEEEYALRIQERRKRILDMKVPLVASEGNGEEVVYYHPGSPKVEAQQKALQPFSLAVRSLLFCAGDTFVSYLDGSAFVALSKLTEYNEARRPEMEAAAEAAGITLRSASEFDVSSLQAALEKREQLRMKLDAVRAASDPTYAARCVRAEERDNSGQPVTNVRLEAGDEMELSAMLQAAQAQLESAQLAYNKRAYTAARRVLKALANVSQAEF